MDHKVGRAYCIGMRFRDSLSLSKVGGKGVVSFSGSDSTRLCVLYRAQSVS